MYPTDPTDRSDRRPPVHAGRRRPARSRRSRRRLRHVAAADGTTADELTEPLPSTLPSQTPFRCQPRPSPATSPSTTLPLSTPDTLRRRRGCARRRRRLRQRPRARRRRRRVPRRRRWLRTRARTAVSTSIPMTTPTRRMPVRATCSTRTARRSSLWPDPIVLDDCVYDGTVNDHQLQRRRCRLDGGDQAVGRARHCRRQHPARRDRRARLHDRQGRLGPGAIDFKIKVSEPGHNHYVDVHAYRPLTGADLVGDLGLSGGEGAGGCALPVHRQRAAAAEPQHAQRRRRHHHQHARAGSAPTCRPRRPTRRTATRCSPASIRWTRRRPASPTTSPTSRRWKRARSTTSSSRLYHS